MSSPHIGDPREWIATRRTVFYSRRTVPDKNWNTEQSLSLLVYFPFLSFHLLLSVWLLSLLNTALWEIFDEEERKQYTYISLYMYSEFYWKNVVSSILREETRCRHIREGKKERSRRTRRDGKTRGGKKNVVGRIRTYAGRPQWISSPSP